jgi:hypothetical protein
MDTGQSAQEEISAVSTFGRSTVHPLAERGKSNPAEASPIVKLPVPLQSSESLPALSFRSEAEVGPL